MSAPAEIGPRQLPPQLRAGALIWSRAGRPVSGRHCADLDAGAHISVVAGLAGLGAGCPISSVRWGSHRGGSVGVLASRHPEAGSVFFVYIGRSFGRSSAHSPDVD